MRTQLRLPARRELCRTEEMHPPVRVCGVCATRCGGRRRCAAPVRYSQCRACRMGFVRHRHRPRLYCVPTGTQGVCPHVPWYQCLECGARVLSETAQYCGGNSCVA